MPRCACVLAFLLALAPLAARATIVVALPEDELVQTSDTIIMGSVLALEALAVPGGHVVTQAQIQVLRPVRGAKRNAVVTVRYPGGRLPNGLAAFVDGAPELRVGDMVFAFLESRAGVRTPVGLRYGMLKVRRDTSGAYLVTRDTDGLILVDRTGKAAKPEVAHLRAVPLDDLVARIEKRMRALRIDPATEVTR